MVITLLDGSLLVSIFYDAADGEYDDNICIRFEEECPVDERLLRADETNIYLTPQQARQLVMALNNACADSMSAANKRRRDAAED